MFLYSGPFFIYRTNLAWSALKSVTYSIWKGMHLKSIYLFIKQIGDDVQVKANEESVNKAS